MSGGGKRLKQRKPSKLSFALHLGLTIELNLLDGRDAMTLSRFGYSESRGRPPQAVLLLQGKGRLAASVADKSNRAREGHVALSILEGREPPI